MTDELKRLEKEKADIEQRIRQLTTLTSIHDDVKLDFIKTRGPQLGHWAVSFRYTYISWHGSDRTWIPAEKWVPIIQCPTREEAVSRIPKALSALQELYDELAAQKKDRSAATETAQEQNNPEPFYQKGGKDANGRPGSGGLIHDWRHEGRPVNAWPAASEDDRKPDPD